VSGAQTYVLLRNFADSWGLAAMLVFFLMRVAVPSGRQQVCQRGRQHDL